MIGWLRERRRVREEGDNLRVWWALVRHPEQGLYSLFKETHLSSGRVALALARLVARGEVSVAVVDRENGMKSKSYSAVNQSYSPDGLTPAQAFDALPDE